MSLDSPSTGSLTQKLKDVGLWMRETIIITMNDIAEAVMEEIPDDLPVASNDRMKGGDPDPTSSYSPSYHNLEHHVLSLSDTGSTQSSHLDGLTVPDDFPNTIQRVSLITRINALYSTGISITRSISRENFKQTPSLDEEETDHVLVMDLPDIESDWIKL